MTGRGEFFGLGKGCTPEPVFYSITGWYFRMVLITFQAWSQNLICPLPKDEIKTPKPLNHDHCEEKRLRAWTTVLHKSVLTGYEQSDLKQWNWLTSVIVSSSVVTTLMGIKTQRFLSICVIRDYFMKFCLHFLVLSLPACSLALAWWGCSLAGDTMAKSGSGFGWGSSTQLSRPTQLYSVHTGIMQLQHRLVCH